MKKNRKKMIICIVISVIAILFITLMSSNNAKTEDASYKESQTSEVKLSGKVKVEEIDYNEAREKIKNSEIRLVEFSPDTLIAKLYSANSEQVYKTKVPGVEVFANYMDGIMETTDIKFRVVEESTADKILFNFISALFVIGIPATIMLFFMHRHNEKELKELELLKESALNDIKNEYEQNKAKIANGEAASEVRVRNVNISFNDIAGINKEKAEVEEIIHMLKNPEKYTEMGAKIPKGVLLTGEPGTGKTLIAKAIATESQVAFISCDGSSFENMYVGVGAEKMRRVFEAAKKFAPSIIFIDEIDVIAQKRYSKSNSSHEQTLNQLLTEMDGYSGSDNVIVIAATNCPEVLDSAITRPGRFDRIINIPLPDKKGRREILEVHAKNKKFCESKEKILDELAKNTSYMSGAELANILNEAAIIATKKEKECINKEEIDEAFTKVILGISKEDKEVSDDKKYKVAIHEAGHAITSRIRRPKTEILQVSIVPRGNAGGYNLFSDDNENSLVTKDELLNDIIVSLGGRAAEDSYYNTISVGASADLESASKRAHAMVYKYAMGTKAQLVRIYGKEEYNDKLEEKMFPEMEKILEDSYDTAAKIIKNNSKLLIELADLLVEKSTLNSLELEELFSRYGI